MSKLEKSLYNIRILDELAEKSSIIHTIHPLIKLLTTLLYIVIAVSYDKYELSALLPLMFYPIIIITLAELPLRPIFKRVLFVLPFVFGIGIFNPILDQKPIFKILGFVITSGWISFLSILLKSILTILAGLILISTTGITRIASGLRMIKIPRIFVLQLLLTYRYISVMLEEVGRTWNAYMLRAPGQKGISYKTWGSLLGQLIMRTFDRAQRVYQAMSLRGFEGEYNSGKVKNITKVDLFYIIGWGTFFVLCRVLNLPALIGAVVTGGTL